MTYALAAGLQQALYAHLQGNVDLQALIGDALFDAPPRGARPPLYVALGDEEVRDLSDKTGTGAQHDLTISVVADNSGFAQVKTVAGVIADALQDAPLSLPRGQLSYLRFHRARAARARNNETRRIDMTFRARLSDDSAA